MPAELPSGTVTLLFTDIEGSTRMLQELGREAYVRALTEHRRLLREAFTSHGGVEVEMQGDSFFFAFPYARDAVAAAVAGQRALAEHVWEQQPIKVRIGLHTGEPMQADGLYAGLDVHWAARVMSAGHGGQILLSARTAELTADEVPDGVPLVDLGEHRLKDLTAPQRLFQLGEGEFPALKALTPRSNLPVAATPLIGRERELAELTGLLLDGARVVTVTGTGGAGKTRVALQAAAEVIEEFRDGVFWVPLAGLRDAALVLPTVAQTVDAQGELDAFLAARQCLLVLDNFEHVIAAAAPLGQLFTTASGIKALVTSRAPLHVNGEHEFPLDPLASAEGVTLFVERARAAGGMLEADETVAEICRRLDNLPLALELAAARTKLLSSKSLLDRLDTRLSLLTGGNRDAPERQQTLRATIEWSHELLHPEAQRLFARLSVFAGSFSLDAAVSVCDAELDTLAALVDLSLLKATGDDRFLMLETIREYAEERLEATGEGEELRRRHGVWIVRLAREAESELEGGDQAMWLARLEAERDNIRAALGYWDELGHTGEILEVAAQCWRFWWTRGYWAEGRRWLDTGLRDTAEGAIAAKALVGAIFLAYLQRDYEASRRLAERQLQVARALGDRVEIARALHALGNVTLEIGERSDAQALYEESLNWSDDHPFSRYTLHSLGYIALLDGRPDRALVFLEQSLAVSKSHGDEGAAADTLGVLAFAAHGAGNRNEAADLLRRSTRIATALDDKPVIATRCLHGAAALLADRGAVQEAARVLGAADQLLEDIGASSRGQLTDLIHSRTLEAMRLELDDAAVAAERNAGRSLTPREALDLAFSALD